MYTRMLSLPVWCHEQELALHTWHFIGTLRSAAGFTIQNGVDNGGGAISITGASSPILTNLILYNNLVQCYQGILKAATCFP